MQQRYQCGSLAAASLGQWRKITVAQQLPVVAAAQLEREADVRCRSFRCDDSVRFSPTNVSLCKHPAAQQSTLTAAMY
ncbi:chloroplastic,Chaperonin GroEL [Trichinella spiralis]|uniref:Chloroplastic,Chaperonin GroEL n=1 Tax=Trichinella spiralis TaxID=6334 RepID=A0ABR3KBC9_TRISP